MCSEGCRVYETLGFMDGELLKDHGREDVFLKGMQFMVVHALLSVFLT